MFSIIRRRITYTNVIMTLALVFAMTGGAYAAKHYLITSTKQISPSVLKALSGKVGPAGSAGPAGGVGPAGPKGEPGVSGKEGAAGKNGPNGESVTSTKLAVKTPNCAEGGSEFTAAEGKKTYACNGKEGSPWTAGGTLPKGASEHGIWSIGTFYKNAGIVSVSIPFTIPLAAPLGEKAVHYIGKEQGFKEKFEATAIKNGECTGTHANPGAASGNLCVFLTAVFAGEADPSLQNGENMEEGAGVSGAILIWGVSTETTLSDVGVWVVTG